MSKNKTLKEALSLSDKRKEELLSFCTKHNLQFESLELLNMALTHTSYVNDFSSDHALLLKDNQRLEFLGDSILGAVAADFLYSKFDSVDEGELSKYISLLVSGDSLSEVAFSIGLPELLLIGKGEEAQGGRSRKTVNADALEAVIAAIYLDLGYEKAKEFVLSFLPSQLDRIVSGKINYVDYKSELQSYFQKKSNQTPKYTLIRTEGPDHMKQFLVSVSLGSRDFGPEWGNSKKNAEQNVAKRALIELGLIEGDRD